jgi:uncharacterized protein (DUF58 family)
MKTRPVVYIVPAIILGLSLIIGSSLLFYVFVFLAVIGMLAFMWVWLGLRGLKVETGDVPVHCNTGDSFNDKLTVTNEGLVPKLLLKARVENNLPGNSNTSILNIPGRQSRSWDNIITCKRRGRYTFGPISFNSSDPLNLFSGERLIGKTREITVYPQVIELPLFRASLSSLIDFGHGSTGRRISQISPSASSIREMVNGDSQEHIHWRSTAHTGKLMVKVFDAEHSSDETKNTWVVLDMGRTVHFGAGDESTVEYGVTVAASLLKKYLDSGIRVGLSIAGNTHYMTSPNGGNVHFSKMLEELALVQADGEELIGDSILDPAQFGSEHCTVIVITPEADEAVIEALRKMKNYGYTVVVVFIDALSFGGRLSPEYAVHSLGSAGIQAYIIRKGDNLARALDTSVALWYSRYV